MSGFWLGVVVGAAAIVAASLVAGLVLAWLMWDDDWADEPTLPYTLWDSTSEHQ